MSGSITVDLQEKWMVQLSATLIRPVGFRFGVLGHLDKDRSVSLQNTAVFIAMENEFIQN